MAISKDAFIQSATDEISNYPTISRRFQIGDPLITQGLAAMAAMLSELSNQIEVTAGEVYLKARDVTILADAAVKGVLPFATPSIAIINLANAGAQSVTVLVGRVLLDQAGRYWRVLTGATVAAGASGTIIAKQVVLRTLTHKVDQKVPFYSVELVAPEVGYIAEVAVTGYKYTPDFCNVNDGEAVYNIRSDENQALSLVFGVDGVAGRQPAAGASLPLSIYDTEGDISLSVGMTYTFEYTNVGDAAVTMTLAQVTQPGAAPMDLVTMAEVTSYPGIYGENAVYLSNFDHLVRKHVTPLTFLSVWNETREEKVRPAGVQNMNTLFVSALRDGTDPATLQSEISKVILGADDSYKIKAVAAVEIEEPLAIELAIPSTFDDGEIIQACRALVLRDYGRASVWARRGGAKILEKDVHNLFRDNVPALTQRTADISVTLAAGVPPLPEHFRYVTEQSLVITAKSAD